MAATRKGMLFMATGISGGKSETEAVHSLYFNEKPVPLSTQGFTGEEIGI